MTTIACDGIHVAFDSRVTSGDIILSDDCDKSYEIDGVYYIGAGSIHDIEREIKAFINDELWEVDRFRSEILVSDGNGDLYCVGIDDRGPFKWRVNAYAACAFGSGGDFAMAAMDMGKTAKQAVEYAKTRDAGTGGKVRQIKLKR